MFYSNGKILIQQDNKKEALAKAVEKLEKFFKEEKGIVAEFLESERHLTLAYVIPDDITFAMMNEVLRPNLEFRSINEQVVILPESEKVNVKYKFTDDEMKDLTNENMNYQVDIEKLEAEKAQMMASYKSRIAEVEDKLKESRQKWMNGYEMRDFDCHVQLDFEEKKKFYIDLYSDGTIRKVDDLSKKDFHVALNHKFEHPIDLFNQPAEDAGIEVTVMSNPFDKKASKEELIVDENEQSDENESII